MRRSAQTFTLRRQIRGAISLLLAGASAPALSTGDPAIEPPAFNDAFLRQSAGAKIDISRFNRANVAMPGDYRADIYVNQVWIGRGGLSLRTRDGTDPNAYPCFDRPLLERMGVDVTRLTAQAAQMLASGDSCRSLSELVEGASATFINSEQRLDASVPQAAVGRQPRGGYVDSQYWDEGIDAARLGYQANAYRSQGDGTSSTRAFVGLDAGLNLGPWRLQQRGNWTYDRHGTGSRYQRVQANVRRSLAPIKSQLVIGEAFTDGVMFDSIGFRGAQLASDDRMYPEYERGYAPTVRGVALSNARVQIRQRGNILYETNVAPGPFEINDLYPTGYGGDLEVVVTEADNSVRVSKVPYAATVNALRPGVTRYSVTGGQYHSPDAYGAPWLLQGIVQHGFTNLFTGSAGVTVSPHYVTAGVGAAVNTRFGAMGADITGSDARQVSEPRQGGQSLRVNYNTLFETTGTHLTLAGYRESRGHVGLTDAMSLQNRYRRGRGLSTARFERDRIQATIGQELGLGNGNFYLTGSYQDYWSRDGHDFHLQAGYNNSYKRVNYGVSFLRQFDLTAAKWDNQIALTVGMPLGTQPRVPYATTNLRRNSSNRTQLQQTVNGSLGRDHAITYGLNATQSRGGGSPSDTSLAASVAYAAPMATVGASASKSSRYLQTAAGISGGLVVYSGGVVFSPNLGETVAVVEAKNAAGARVTNASGLRVDPWGRAVVSNLTPFARNAVELDPRGLPMNVELMSSLQHVTPTAGAVVKLQFNAAKTGRTALIDTRHLQGAILPFGADVLDAGGQVVGTVAQGGRIFARGLKESDGQLTVVLDNGTRQCHYQFPIERASATANATPAHIHATCDQ
jgi:outer membrane usher protein